MIRVTIELIPFGEECNKKIISEIEIMNTGNVNEFKEYEYEFNSWLQDESPFGLETNYGEGGWVHKTRGRVEHDRRLPVYLLLYKVLHKIIQPFGHKWAYDEKERLIALDGLENARESWNKKQSKKRR